MPVLNIPSSGLSLVGSSSTKKSDSHSLDILGLTLSDNLIEDMIKCVRSGKAIELSLGKDPEIIYGTKSQHISFSPDPFTHELYRSTYPQNISPNSHSQSSHTEDDMTNPLRVDRHPTMFMGKFYSMGQPSKARVDKASAGASAKAASKTGKAKGSDPVTEPVDTALAVLQGSIASANAKKLENTTKFMKGSGLPPASKAKGQLPASNKNRFLSQQGKSLSNGTTRSMPTSPALNGVGSPSLGPTSVPFSQQQAEKTKAIRRPIIHQLALGPKTEKEVRQYKSDDCTDAEFTMALEKVADPADGKWKLGQKSFRELDVWKYEYESEEDRQIAIDNAVRVYDKLRLAPSEAEWERLLPKEERGTGKTLSKLQVKIANGIAKPPKINVQRAEDSGRDSPAEDLAKSHTSAVKADAVPRSSSQPPTSKPKKVGEKEAQAKRLLSNKPTKTAKPALKAGPKTVEKKSPEKESSRIKSSKFVNDSDDDDDIPIAITKTLQPKPMAGKKRIRDDTDASDAGARTPLTKKAKSDVQPQSNTPNKHRISDASQASRTTNTSYTSNTSYSSNASYKNKVTTSTSPQKSSPLASSPPTNATDIDSSSSSSYRATATLKRKPDHIDEAASKRHQKTVSSASTSSLSSLSSGSASTPNGSISGRITPSRETLNMARRFKLFYTKYLALYDELNSKDVKRRDHTKMEELMEMHHRLEGMKRDILGGLN